jgi:hypothetical protein
LIGYVEYGAERQEERYTVERCDEGRSSAFIPAKAGIHGIYPRIGQKEQGCRNNRVSITMTEKWSLKNNVLSASWPIDETLPCT